jgi:transcriptional regulator with XRE-family HTH domain
MLKVTFPILLTFEGANPHLLRFGIEQRVHFGVRAGVPSVRRAVCTRPTRLGPPSPLSFSVTAHAGESTLWRMVSTTEYEKALLKAHALHAGIYRRLANQLGVDPSYVSRVARGKREEPKILRALLDELHQIQLIFTRLESNELGDGEPSSRAKLKTYKTTVARAKVTIPKFRARRKYFKQVHMAKESAN